MQGPARRTGPVLPQAATWPTAEKPKSKYKNVSWSWHSHLERKNGVIGATEGRRAIRVGNKQPQIARDRASIGGCSCDRYPAPGNGSKRTGHSGGILRY